MTDADSTEFFYREYEVQVVTVPLASGEWDVVVRIFIKTKEGKDLVRGRILPETYQTKDKALSYGSALGKKLIDDGLE